MTGTYQDSRKTRPNRMNHHATAHQSGLSSKRPFAALVLILVATVSATGQRGGGAMPGGFNKGGFQPAVPTPFSIPVLNPFFSFPARLSATVSGSWFGRPPLWGSGFALGFTPHGGCGGGSRVGRAGCSGTPLFQGWNGAAGYGAPPFYPPFADYWVSP